MRATSITSRFFRHAFFTVYPRLCEICGTTLIKGEDTLCLGCMTMMPRTYLHRDPAGRVRERLVRLWPVERTAAWFYYDAGDAYARLILSGKFGQRPRLCRCLGEMFAREIVDDNFFDGIDVIVPIPLHWRRRFSRGYNQSHEIACGVSRASGIPVDDSLYAVRAHSSQTGFSRSDRLRNVMGSMALRRPGAYAGQHVLLLDDIFTTGATMETAIRAILDGSDASTRPRAISILTLGLTREHAR